MKKSTYLKARRLAREAAQHERGLVPHMRVPLQDAVDRAMALRGEPAGQPVEKIVSCLTDVMTTRDANSLGLALQALRAS